MTSRTMTTIQQRRAIAKHLRSYRRTMATWRQARDLATKESLRQQYTESLAIYRERIFGALGMAHALLD